MQNLQHARGVISWYAHYHPDDPEAEKLHAKIQARYLKMIPNS
jgi:hypothetical protein